MEIIDKSTKKATDGHWLTQTFNSLNTIDNCNMSISLRLSVKVCGKISVGENFRRPIYEKFLTSRLTKSALNRI